MHLPTLLAASTAALASAAALDKRYVFDPTPGSDALAAQALAKLTAWEATHPFSSGTCNVATAHVRQEWNSLSYPQRLAYIQAVKCLQSKPSKLGAQAPGAKTRYDDFVATHIEQTLFIHGTGNFLTWHRYFTWAYEHALQTECGYQGTQPYVNWAKIASNPLQAPMFDGSPYSMSGNGAYVNHTPAYIPSPAAPEIVLQPGVGGGCVTSGPFENFVVNLGPVAPALNYIKPNPLPSGLGYNPRCLRRDISYIASREALTDCNVTALLSDYDNILDFQNTMQGNFPAGLIGIHTAGHFLVGGDPGGDLFSSPGDPYFFLHHSAIDRLYWIWQNQDLQNRQHALAGDTALLDPNSPPATLNQTLFLNGLAPNLTIYNAQSTTNGPFCYIYV